MSPVPPIPGSFTATGRPARSCPLAVLAIAALVLGGCSQPAATPTSPVVGSAVSTPSPSASSTPTPTASPTTVEPSAPPTAAAKPTVAAAPKDTRAGSALSKPFTVNGIPVISKKHPINASFRRTSVTSPNGLTKDTQRALTAMTAAARSNGVTIRVRSGYRSYGLQAQILASKIREYGSETMARRYNAAPGRSEHQTGLAVDLWDGVTWGVGVRNTRTGRWLWANAWRYGFILRYPNGKEKITGYAFEPWHYRWIGTTDAKNFGRNTDQSLEEYLGLA